MESNFKSSDDVVQFLKKKFIEMFSRLNFRSDTTLWTLIIVNVVTLVTCITENQSLAYVLLLAWSQSYIVGIFAAINISKVKQYAIEPATEDKKEYNPNNSKSTSAILFFVFYSFFHIGYLIFILVFHWLGDMSLPTLLEFSIPAILLVLHHWYVYRKRQKAEENSTELPRLSKMIQEPFLRSLPVHFVIILGGLTLILGISGMIFVIIFQLMKLFMDMLFHAYKNL